MKIKVETDEGVFEEEMDAPKGHNKKPNVIGSPHNSGIVPDIDINAFMSALKKKTQKRLSLQ